MDTALAKANEIANNPAHAVMLIKELRVKNSTEPDVLAVIEREAVRDQIACRITRKLLPRSWRNVRQRLTVPRRIGPPQTALLGSQHLIRGQQIRSSHSLWPLASSC